MQVGSGGLPEVELADNGVEGVGREERVVGFGMGAQLGFFDVGLGLGFFDQVAVELVGWTVGFLVIRGAISAGRREGQVSSCRGKNGVPRKGG